MTDQDATQSLSLSLTRSLAQRLEHTAKEEGVTVDQLAAELLAEGVTLRAWEIVERKSAMRGPAPDTARRSHGGPAHGNHANGNHGNHGNQRRGGQAGGNWMEDRASFLEYVRNQEKRHR